MNISRLFRAKSMNQERVIKVTIYSFLVIFLLLACDIGIKPTGPAVDRALNIFDEAQTRLNDGNENWQLILQDTREKLLNEGFENVGNQVKQLIDRTAGNSLIVTFCIEDKFRRRLSQELENIKAQLLGNPVNQQLTPVVCKASAKGNPIVDLSDYPNAIELVGYDMGTHIKVILVEKTGTQDITSFYNSGLYEATITLGANGPSLSDNSQKIVTYSKDTNEELKSIGITRTKPEDCEVKEIFPPYTPNRPLPITYYPPLVKGDADFHGHGPNVHAEVKLVNLGDRVIAMVGMNARENETNGSTADGFMAYTIYNPPGGYQVLRINADNKTFFDYRDSSHEPDEIPGQGGSFIEKAVFIGDTGDNDICGQPNCGGYQTSIKVEFNEIKFSLIQVDNCTPRDNISPSEIGKKYAEFGGPQSQLGRALGPELYTADSTGRMQHFEGGWIYWTPQTGAHVIWGAIYDEWAYLGYEAGLGYPVTDEFTTPDGIGRFNHFEGGSIYWAPQTGAHEVHGSIKEQWANMGWELSPLGYPVSDEYIGDHWVGGSDGDWTRVSEFEHGFIEYFWDERGAQVAYK